MMHGQKNIKLDNLLLAPQGMCTMPKIC